MKILNNDGSVALEATLVVPLFIFAMLAIYHIGQASMAEATLYEAAAETVEYMAEYAYVDTDNYILPNIVFYGYIDDKASVEKYVDGGVAGVDFFGTNCLDKENKVVLKVNYSMIIDLPFLPELRKDKTITIKQRAYVGFKEASEEKNADGNNIMVYVAENESVYHIDSGCTHLDIIIFSREKGEATKEGYSSCELCGDDCGDYVYVTEDGGRYHSTKSCSGLKRSIYEISLDEAGDLNCCSRCGN